MQEDYFLREIDRLGLVIRAILAKLFTLPAANQEQVYLTATAELQDKLKIDVEFLRDGNLLDKLLQRQFSNESLEAFAELLFEMLPGADSSLRGNIAQGIRDIYAHLDREGTALSLIRYYILKELKNY